MRYGARGSSVVPKCLLIFAAWFGMDGNLWIRYGSYSRMEFRGVYPELQQHTSNGHDAALSFSVLTYTIDYWHNGIRTRGLPTLCWVQLFLLVLVGTDLSELIRVRGNSR